MLRNPQIVSTRQERIASLASESPEMGFTSLAYLMDLPWLLEAYHRTRKKGATGVDGQTWHEYGQNLEANLQSPIQTGQFKRDMVRRPKPARCSE